MSIKDSKEEYEKVLKIAHLRYPKKKIYINSPENCKHNYCFIVYCDGIEDIVRCNKCGDEKVCPCSFDDEYN